jgi:hypothetical protein
MMTKRLGIAAVALVGFGDVARADSLLSGAYASTFGMLVLVEDGTHVIGHYTYGGGSELDGAFDGAVLRFTWHEPTATGSGVFVRTPDGTLVGTWGSLDNPASGGVWVARPSVLRETQTLETNATSAAAIAMPISPLGESRPEPGLSFEVYAPWDGASGPGMRLFGVGGLGVGLGDRLTPHLYIGGTADFESMIPTNISSPAEGTRLRAGGEVRYIFGDHTMTTLFPRTSYVALRGGVESLGGQTGHYADATFGVDWWLGQFWMGVYLSGGVSIEPMTSYVTPAASSARIAPDTTSSPAVPTTPSVVAPTVTIGMKFGFG